MPSDLRNKKAFFIGYKLAISNQEVEIIWTNKNSKNRSKSAAP